ncbi:MULTISPECIES: hypothetical protein [unclassified Chryseobacterium]|uniref:hypothetical protein n=1 Tax=unclassified Chryseobacterium TaxID=2593645 RepID=UPI000D754DC5|nr:MULTISPECIES: hypothetical protein [unclassified Chryseobacterium]PXW13548.1 hypothetical protein C8D70_109165 [Chryseobacterium sp. CBTAP 102]
MSEFNFSEEVISQTLEETKGSREDSQADCCLSIVELDVSPVNSTAGYLIVTAQCISITVPEIFLDLIIKRVFNLGNKLIGTGVFLEYILGDLIIFTIIKG